MDSPHQPLATRLRVLLELGRVSNLPTVWSNVIAGLVLGCNDVSNKSGVIMVLIILLIGASLLYMGGTTLNDAFDVAWDEKHRPERPIPSGRMAKATVWCIGIVQLGLGAALFWWGAALNSLTAWMLGALVGSIVIYDWLHKRTAWAILPMGACRLLLGLAAATGAVAMESRVHLPLWWAASLGAYVAGLTLAARRESTGGKTGWFACLLMFSLFLCLVAMALKAFFALRYPDMPLGSGLTDASMRWLNPRIFERADYGVTTAVLFVVFGCWVESAIRLLRSGAPDRIGAAVGRLLAGIVLLDALAVSLVDWRIACGLVLLFPLTLLWQRRIAAT